MPSSTYSCGSPLEQLIPTRQTGVALAARHIGRLDFSVADGNDIADYFATELDEHCGVIERSKAVLTDAFVHLVEACMTSIRGGGKLLFFGNGGSAADARHLATELTVRYKANRSSIPAIALATDGSALTACGNDLGFDQVSAHQIEAIGKPDDVAIARVTARRGFSGAVASSMYDRKPSSLS